MQREFWLQRWQQNLIGFHQDEVNPYLQKYWPSLNLEGQGVFVPLCGKSRDLSWLAQQGHQVLGVELSEIAVKDFFREQQLDPEVLQQDDFLCYQDGPLAVWMGDFFALKPEHMSDIRAVFDRASLVAMPIEMRSDYVAKMRECLAPGSTILLVTMDYDSQQMDGPPFAVSAAEVESLYGPWCEISLLEQADILAANARFQERGLNRLDELVFRLEVK